MAIISFRSRALRRLFENDDTRGVSGRHIFRVRDILLALDQAIRIDEMSAYPGWAASPTQGRVARILERIGFGKLARNLPIRQWDGV